MLHDARTGLSTVVNDADPLTIVRARGQITVNDLAGVMFATDAPSRNEVEKARRKLDGLARSKQLEKTPQTAQSGAAMATVYTIPDSG